VVATSLGIGDEDSVFAELDGVDPRSGAHLELDEEFQATQEPLHPWAREMYRRGLSFNGNERSKLYLGSGRGTYLDHSDLLGADSPLDGRAVVAGDFDEDGDPDLFVHNLQRERHELFRNDFDRPGFLALRLVGQGPEGRANGEAIGAEVVVDGPRGPLVQLLARGSGFASCAPPELVFGLGEAASAAVRVRWPGGVEESFGELPAGGRFVLTQGSGAARAREVRPARLPDPWPEGLEVDLGATVPSLVLEDSQGQRVTLDPRVAAAGGRLYLAFWASYCAPCLQELPALEALHQAPDQTVVAISVDVPGERARAQAALQRAGVGFEGRYLALDEESNEGRLDELVDLLRLPIPTTLVLDAEGRLVEVLRRIPAD